jgi:hypothetical protein
VFLFSLLRYGDISPKTPAGRVIACLCALSGAGTIAMLVSVLVDRYQRVFNRKLYVEPVQIDFDDYSDDEESNEFIHIQGETARLEINQDEEIISDPLSSPSSNRVRCIISYTNDDRNEESQNLIDRLRSIVSETQSDLNDIKLNVITDTAASDQFPLGPSPFRFNLDVKNNTSGITTIIEDSSPSSDDDGTSENSVQLSSHVQNRRGCTDL